MLDLSGAYTFDTSDEDKEGIVSEADVLISPLISPVMIQMDSTAISNDMFTSAVLEETHIPISLSAVTSKRKRCRKIYDRVGADVIPDKFNDIEPGNITAKIDTDGELPIGKRRRTRKMCDIVTMVPVSKENMVKNSSNCKETAFGRGKRPLRKSNKMAEQCSAK